MHSLFENRRGTRVAQHVESRSSSSPGLHDCGRGGWFLSNPDQPECRAIDDQYADDRSGMRPCDRVRTGLFLTDDGRRPGTPWRLQDEGKRSSRWIGGPPVRPGRSGCRIRICPISWRLGSGRFHRSPPPCRFTESRTTWSSRVSYPGAVEMEERRNAEPVLRDSVGTRLACR